MMMTGRGGADIAGTLTILAENVRPRLELLRQLLTTSRRQLMSQGFGHLRNADDLVYFKDPQRGVDVERQLDELSNHELAALFAVLKHLWKYPESLMDVRAQRGPVRGYV